MDSESPQSNSSQPPKEKKTRRRLRLSCVECTKRRQKCDRQHPCSLCVSRGVAHLCRWETVPLARPPPARPPASALKDIANSSDTALVASLKQRIAKLESELEQTRESCSSPSVARSSSSRTQSTPPFSGLTDSGGGTCSTSSPPQTSDISQHRSPASHFAEQAFSPGGEEPDIGTSPFPLDEDAYETTSTLARLSLAHHGEFIGRGSLICALHAMTAKTTPRFLYAKSTDAMSEYREPVQRFSNLPFAANIAELVEYLPPIPVIEGMTAAFFAEVNWRYGIPEDWFRGTRREMWNRLRYRTKENASQINANWLMLLFAIMASAPQYAYDEANPPCRCSDDYFMCAMMARRMVEDDYLDVPSPSYMTSAADGTVLGCLATPLLCEYLGERGRISEAWKLVGNGIRNAMAVGLHRDPEWKLWQMMSIDEKQLRRRAWWGLFMADKTYSTVLSRPQALRKEIYDVTPYSPHNPDGSRNLLNVGQNVTVSLMELLGEALEKCVTTDFPSCTTFFEMDRKFQEWEKQIPYEYQLKLDVPILQECNPQEMKTLTRQRYTLHTWYFTGRLKLHIASATGLGRPNQAPQHMRKTMEECRDLCVQVIKYQTSAYQSLFQSSDDPLAPSYPGNCWLFEGCFSLFEASVALITVMSRLPSQSEHVMTLESSHAIDLALATFSEVSHREQGRKTGETAARAFEVLSTIRDCYSTRSAMNEFLHRDLPVTLAPLEIKSEPQDTNDALIYDFNMELDDNPLSAFVTAISAQTYRDHYQMTNPERNSSHGMPGLLGFS